MDDFNGTVPDVTAPIVMPDGTINPVWFHFFIVLLSRTGGDEGSDPTFIKLVAAKLDDLYGLSNSLSPNPITPGYIESKIFALMNAQVPQAKQKPEPALEVFSHGKQVDELLHALATGSFAGFMSASDKSKLDTIAGGSSIASVTATAPVSSSGGANPNITLANVTTASDGSMIASDKVKLNGIAAGAQVNVSTNLALGSVTTTSQPVTNSNGTGFTLPAVTGASAGLMISSDKSKLDLMVYATGSWTPVITCATPGNLATTFNYQNGTYTRIGDMVTVFFRIAASAFTWTTASGDIRITGLPFAAAGDPLMSYSGSLDYFAGFQAASYTQAAVTVTSGNSFLNISAFNVTNGSANSAMQIAAVPSGTSKDLIASVTYKI